MYMCVHIHVQPLYTVLHALFMILPHPSKILHVRSGYMTLIGVHELYRQMHPDQGLVANLFAVDPLSLFGYTSQLAPPIL